MFQTSSSKTSAPPASEEKAPDSPPALEVSWEPEGVDASNPGNLNGDDNTFSLDTHDDWNNDDDVPMLGDDARKRGSTTPTLSYSPPTLQSYDPDSPGVEPSLKKAKSIPTLSFSPQPSSQPNGSMYADFPEPEVGVGADGENKAEAPFPFSPPSTDQMAEIDLTEERTIKDRYAVRTKQAPQTHNGVEIISLDDDDVVVDDAAGDELVGSFLTIVIDILKYCAFILVGDTLVLAREPIDSCHHNVAVYNKQSQQKIGKLKPFIAAVLAPLLDSGKLRLKATVVKMYQTEGCPVNIAFYSSPSDVAHLSSSLMLSLRNVGERFYPSIPLAPVPVRVMTPSVPQTSHRSAFDMLEEQNFGKLFEKVAVEFESLPEYHEKYMTCTLHPYQRQGLHWMMSKEQKVTMDSVSNKEDEFVFWEKENNAIGQSVYRHVLTKTSQDQPPQHPRGGILADEMGLGKTTQIVALILNNSGRADVVMPKPDKNNNKPNSDTKQDSKEEETDLSSPTPTGGPDDDGLDMNIDDEELIVGEDDESADDGDDDLDNILDEVESDAEPETASAGPAAAPASPGVIPPPNEVVTRPTLIVCPLSVISNWRTQLKMHSKVPLRVCVYHGPSRFSHDAESFSQQHVVITTYNILAQEYSPIADQLKEAAEEAQAKKKAEARAKALGVPYLEATGSTEQGLSTESASSLKHSKKRSRSRRGDGLPLLFTYEWHRVVLDEAHIIRGHRTLQSQAASALRGKRRWCLTGTPLQNKIDDIFALFRFLRMKPFDDYEIWSRHIKISLKHSFNPKTIEHLQILLASVCLRRRKTDKYRGKTIVELPKKSARTHHIELSENERKVYEKVEQDGKRVFSNMMDGTPVAGAAPVNTYASILAALTRMRQACDHPKLLPAETLEELGLQGDTSHSSKIKALINELTAYQQQDPTFKAVVFSQWTSMLDIVEKVFREMGLKWVRLDGQMSSTQRQAALFNFQNDRSFKIFLISLKAGGVGLNLTAANKVFLLDPWWNPATEDQAIDRVHRMGQSKDVEVVHFIVKNSVEEKLVKLQAKKQKMIAGTLTALGKKKKSQQERMQELRYLFGQD